MRLREIQRHLQAAQVPNKIEYETPSGPGVVHRLRNLRAWRRAIMYLRDVGVFDPYIEDLLENPAITESVIDVISGDRSDVVPLVNQLMVFRRGVEGLQAFLDNAIPPQQQNTLVIQVPQPESLQSLAGLIEDLTKFFTVAGRAEQDDEVTIGTPAVQAFDSGSFYLEVVLATAVGVTTVGMITKAAFSFLRQYQIFIANQQTLRAFKAYSADVESAQRFNETARSAFLQAEAHALQERRFPKAQQEAQAALLAAIQENAKLLEKGVKILPPFSANQETEKAFPTGEELKILVAPEMQKLLGASTSSETSDASASSKAAK